MKAAFPYYYNRSEQPAPEKPFAEQIEELGLPIQPSTLQFYANRDGAKQFKNAYTYEVREQNISTRISYRHEHKEKTLTN
jgi:hypothetical protein